MKGLFERIRMDISWIFKNFHGIFMDFEAFSMIFPGFSMVFRPFDWTFCAFLARFRREGPDADERGALEEVREPRGAG